MKTQLVVIGAGPGGYAAAFLAADLGMQVTVVDPEPNPGGVCLYRGCIPSKTLLHAAHLIEEARRAERWGLTFGEPRIDVDKLRGWKTQVVEQLTGGLGQLRNRRKITYIQGKAAFTDAGSLQISEANGEVSPLAFDHAIVATRSRPVTIPSLDLNTPRMMTSTGALMLNDVPETLLVVGGGYIGLELGTVYAALGSRVTVVEMLPGILTGADRDLVRVVAKRLNDRFENVMTNTKVVSSAEVANGVEVVLQNKDGKTSRQVFEKVLVAVGRRPNSEGLGLEHTSVAVDDQGFISTDVQKRTAEASIFAIGDVAGQPMLAHKASHEGRVAVEAIAGHKSAFEPAAIPAVVFTDPEIAWCGLTELEAKTQKRPFQAVRFPWAASGRALTQDCTDGMTKLIIDPDTERILGVGIVGTGAGELIAEGVLAMEMAALATDVKLTIHPHPL